MPRRPPVRLAAVLAAGATAVSVLAAHRGSTAPTYRDVAPILAQKCASCHVTGGIAPFALTSPADAKAHAAGILQMTQARAMPPGPPAADSPGFIGQSRRILTSRELDTLAQWVHAGAPLGEGAANPAPGPTALPAPVGSSTTTLTIPEPYTPHAISGGLDDYHCFVLDPKLTRDVFVTG